MSERLDIRLATVTEAEDIALESMAEIEHNLHWSWTPQRVRKAMADAETNVAVALEEGKVIAFGIMEYKDNLAHLLLFAVREDARRRGVGSSLLRWLEQVARVAGVAHFKVEARRDNAAALAFYRKHGYCKRLAVTGMYQGTEDGIRLEKGGDTVMEERDA